MRFVLLLLSLTISETVCSQNTSLFQKVIQLDWYFDNEIKPDKYYPENSFIKKNKIHLIVDSSEFIQPEGFRINAYDYKGRIILKGFTNMSDLANPFIYKRNRDTLFRFKYRENIKLYSFEKFVYDRHGKIARYEECRNYYGYDNAFTVKVEVFFYSKNGSLESKLEYYENKYVDSLDEQLNISLNNLRLVDAVSYDKIIRKEDLLIVGTHRLGKPEKRFIDTVRFNKNGQLIGYNNFVKSGSMGCMTGSNINRKTVLKYSADTVHSLYTISNCISSYPDYRCLSRNTRVDEESLSVFENGLKKIKYKFWTIKEKKEKRIISKYAYQFYK